MIIKTGSGFWRLVRLTDKANTSADWTGYTVKMDLRAPFQAAPFYTTGSVAMPADGVCVIGTHATAKWPVGEHETDVKITDPAGNVVHTQTFTVTVVRSRTE